jgi:hypothetical protein
VFGAGVAAGVTLAPLRCAVLEVRLYLVGSNGLSLDVVVWQPLTEPVHWKVISTHKIMPTSSTAQHKGASITLGAQPALNLTPSPAGSKASTKPSCTQVEAGPVISAALKLEQQDTIIHLIHACTMPIAKHHLATSSFAAAIGRRTEKRLD